LNRIQHLSAFLLSNSLKPIEVLIMAVCLFWIYLLHLSSIEFQPDETFWIVSSVRLDKFVSGNFNSPIWTDIPLISYEVRPIPSYFVAVGQRIGGIQVSSLPEYWDWLLPTEENIARGAVPSAEVIWWSRIPMALITVFTLSGMGLFLARAHSRAAAYLLWLSSTNDYFLTHLRRAMSEAPLLLFTVLVFYASCRLLNAVQENSWKKILFWSALAGMFSGLAGQSKLTGLMCTGIPILGVLIFILTSSDFPRKHIGYLILGVTFIAIFTSLVVFVASYPFFYRNSVHRILTTFYIRSQVVTSQMDRYPDQVIQKDQRLNILFQRVFDYPLNLHTDPRVSLALHWINFLVAGFGLLFTVYQIKRRAKNQEIFLIFLLGTITCAVPMFFVPFDWDRYYLYPIFFACIYFSIGLSQLLLAVLGASGLRLWETASSWKHV
jgi:hypothetical protein